MIVVVNFLLWCAALFSGVSVFYLKNHVMELERQYIVLKQTSGQLQQQLHLLHAEWTTLTHPERLVKLAGPLKFKSPSLHQWVDVRDHPATSLLFPHYSPKAKRVVIH